MVQLMKYQNCETYIKKCLFFLSQKHSKWIISYAENPYISDLLFINTFLSIQFQ